MPTPSGLRESGDTRGGAAPRPLWKRLAWMATIWLASVLVLGAVAAALRFWLVG